MLANIPSGAASPRAELRFAKKSDEDLVTSAERRRYSLGLTTERSPLFRAILLGSEPVRASLNFSKSFIARLVAALSKEDMVAFSFQVTVPQPLSLLFRFTIRPESSMHQLGAATTTELQESAFSVRSSMHESLS